jgi:hypothetical protein
MTSHNTRTSRGRRFGLIAGVVAGSLLLAGCSGGAPADPGSASPTAAESASASATPTPTPTPSAVYKPADASGPAQNVPVPVLPDVAKTETKEGLEAFAKYWYSTLSYAYETGDMAPLEAVSEPSCGSCEKVKHVVEGWHSEGRWLVGGRMTVEGVQSKFLEVAPKEYQVLIQVRQEPVSYYNADKSLDEATEILPSVGDIMVAGFDGGNWKAKTVEHLVNE